jgi:hypothetical protein
VGGEGQNIYEQLTNSSVMWLAHECDCDQSSFQLNTYSVLVWSAESLRRLSAANTQPAAAKNNNQKTSLEKLTCHQCLRSYRFARGYVARSTWIHRFEIDRQTEEHFRFESYPTIIEFEELTTQRIVQFQLAYFTISSNMGTAVDPKTGKRRVVNPLTHQTSVHYIKDSDFIYYDGMGNPNGIPVPSDLWKTHSLSAVVYIRKPE